MSDARLVAYCCSLHASTDFREKLYKVFQNAAKLVAAQPGDHARAASIASTLSQSRGIFKVLKWVNNFESYRNAESEQDPVLRGLKQTEAWLNSVVTIMQDAISLNKLFKGSVVGAKFEWWMNFLDLLLSLLLAGIAAHALQLLQSSGIATPKAQRQMLLLLLELGVRVGDAIALLQATSRAPGSGRKLWSAPSPVGALLANALSATFATTAVGIKKWAALPAPAPSLAAAELQPKRNGGDEQQQQQRKQR